MTELAKRYGGSLYDLAAEENLGKDLLDELDTIVACFKQEPAYLRLLSTPNLPKKERTGLIDEAFSGQTHPYLVNFLKILCDEGALRELPGCAEEFRNRYNADNGILRVVATSAVPLNAAAKEKLLAKLAAMTGKTIDLTAKTDPAVIGGIRLNMEGVQMDGTVRHRLETLRGGIDDVVL